MLRTKATVEDGFTKVVQPSDGNDKLIEYQPGNGYKYLVYFCPMGGLGEVGASLLGCVHGSTLVVLFNWGPGRSMLVAPPSAGGLLHWNYVWEKLANGLSEQHAVVLAELIGYVVGRPAISCEEYRRGG